jgi:hypothetical protein
LGSARVFILIHEPAKTFFFFFSFINQEAINKIKKNTQAHANDKWDRELRCRRKRENEENLLVNSLKSHRRDVFLGEKKINENEFSFLFQTQDE